MKYYIRVSLLSCGIRVYKVVYRKWWQLRERDLCNRYWSVEGAKLRLNELLLVNNSVFNVTF